MTTVMPDTDIELRTVVEPYEDSDDGREHRTHIVRPTENEHLNLGPRASGQDVVDTARFLGEEVVALCGYRWVPKRNPEKYPACQTCMDIAAYILREEGE